MHIGEYMFLYTFLSVTVYTVLICLFSERQDAGVPVVDSLS